MTEYLAVRDHDVTVITSSASGEHLQQPAQDDHVSRASFFPRYVYITTIAIGTRTCQESGIPLEVLETVQAKVVNAYIPAVLQDYRKRDPGGYEGQYKIDAEIPKNSDLIILRFVGKEKNRNVYVALHLRQQSARNL